MSPNVLDVLFASPLGLVAGALVLIVVVALAATRRRKGSRRPSGDASATRAAGREPSTRAAASEAAGEDGAAPRRTQSPAATPTRPPVTTVPVATPAAAVDVAPGAGATPELAREPSADHASVPTPSPASDAGAVAWSPVELPDAAPASPAGAAGEPPAVAVAAPRLPADDTAGPAAAEARAAPPWFDAIPTPDVVEVSGPEADLHEVALPSRDLGLEPPPDGGRTTATSAAHDPEAAWPAPELALGRDVVASAPALDRPCDEPRHDVAPAASPASRVAAPAIEAPPVVEPPPPAATGCAGPTPARLLVVDDSAVVRAKLRKLIESDGHQVEVARDGREALALLTAGRYAMMVTDLEMPTMSGFELIAAVRASAGLAALPIVAITGHDDLEPYRQRLPGLAGLFRKPWVDGELLAHLAGVLAQPGPPATTAGASTPARRPQPVAAG